MTAQHSTAQRKRQFSACTFSGARVQVLGLSAYPAKEVKNYRKECKELKKQRIREAENKRKKERKEGRKNVIDNNSSNTKQKEDNRTMISDH